MNLQVEAILMKISHFQQRMVEGTHLLLYYTLLSQKIPSVKIAEMIKTVIRYIFPAIDVDQLKLPQRSCAD